MNDRLARWLTPAANLAVLLGILLLVAELDQNRDLMRAQTRHEMAMGIVDLLQTPAADGELAHIMYRAHHGEALTPTEWMRYHMRTNALFRYWENVHYQYREGLYDDAEFSRQRDAWQASMINSRPAKAYWCRVRELYSPPFMAEMDRLVPDACEVEFMPGNHDQILAFARNYTDAWNSGDPAQVSAHYANDGVLLVNGSPNEGTAAITALAESFMVGFPDMKLSMEELEIGPDDIRYHWRFEGSNSGPGGTGQAVNFTGYEHWVDWRDGKVHRSEGHFDEAEYQRQLEEGYRAG